MDIDTHLRLIEQNFPQITIQTTHPITRGWDSFVLEINSDLIFRFPMRDDVMEYLQKEIHLLPQLEPTLSTPIPHFTYIGHGNDDYPFQFVGYRKLNGTFLEDPGITAELLATLAPQLATFFNELHRFPLAPAIQAGVPDYTAERWRERYQEIYADLQKRVFPQLDADLRIPSEHLWERFLENKALFSFQPVLIHTDLACEHILCDPERSSLTGVIDWGDTSIGDPALDFVGLYAEHGKAFVENVLSHYQGPIDDAFWQRIEFYNRYSPYSKLLYGAYTGKEDMIEQGKEELRELFR